MEKQCNKCGKILSIDNFQKRKFTSGNEGYYNACRECRKSLIHKAYLKRKSLYPVFIKNCIECDKTFATIIQSQLRCKADCKPLTERRKDQIYLSEHPEIDRKEYFKEKNKKKFNNKYRKAYYEANPEKLKIQKERAIKRRDENKEEYRERRKKYRINRLNNDINFRLKKRLSNRIRSAINGNKKYKHSIDLLGCSINEVKNHLEIQFKKGMTWDNWGVMGWHIDHIIPISTFDFTKKEDQYKCWHYTNLQPLWAKDNIQKSNKIIEKQLVLL